ncbi:Amidophosphoribosyltransferase [Zancudomyces culisetae]|uniref:Amidophosphoribosyltransferase n=1 Tax=Zancudomyces culisetae TaxID=1213189 RepID=A0A1R1PXK1_ZANCU|nr:Amidophosphoribosyltransferase [Zancudomyces culisetae]OMH85705.1 Amidophosphoribosyltransferase [Zancudomyces culisetae]|eukprot:OMH78975.1 Amidophosphoribosyltransferase [Zancudomyces culisetae]
MKGTDILREINEEDVFRAIKELYTQCVGGYACIAMIAGPVGAKGMTNGSGDEGLKGDYMFASESAVMEALGFDHFEPVLPGEAIIVTKTKVTRRKLIETPEWRPCIFEYVYFARPDSIIDDIPVSDARLEMGTKLAHTVRRLLGDKHDIDVVIPVPDTSRIIALQLSQVLNLPYREGFNKNRYVGRTFIMPGQENRRKSVRRKLNAMHYEFNNKNVLIVDDSIVRGTTSSEIIQMARDAGAKKVYFASAAPAIRFQNVYGIDMPSRKELVAYNRTEDEISTILGADKVIYQTLDDLVDCCKKFNPSIKCFEASVFDGNYVTGGVSKKYLNTLESQRSDSTLHSQTVSPVASGISNIFEDS